MFLVIEEGKIGKSSTGTKNFTSRSQISINKQKIIFLLYRMVDFL